MKITVICDHCGAQFSTKPENAGRRGTCPKCQQSITVPELDSSSADEAGKTCPKCNAELEAGQAFCESCGEQLLDGAVRKSARRRSSKYARRHEKETMKKLLTARIIIIVVGILIILGAVISVPMLKKEMHGEPIPPLGYAIIVAQLLLGFIFMGLFFLAKNKPFGATLTALILYVTLQLVSVALDPATLLHGWIIKVLIIMGLAAGVRASLTLRRFKAEGRI